MPQPNAVITFRVDKSHGELFVDKLGLNLRYCCRVGKVEAEHEVKQKGYAVYAAKSVMKKSTLFAPIFVLCTAFPVLADIPQPVREDAYLPVNLDEARLGQLLFWDPILSGNGNIACGSCHHPRFATSDGLALGLGEGGIGLGPERKPDPENLPEQRIPRNSPSLFNLGAREFTTLFHDGRIEVDANRASGLRTPLDDDMLVGFNSVLSAQTMFPVLSGDEMAGHYSENDVSQAVRRGIITGPGGAWDIISKRVADIELYAEEFRAVYPEIADGREIAFTDISNAIAAFVEFEWRSDDSPFDKHLRGEQALEGAALDGMELFYGAAGCSACHSGVFQTDHGFHAMGVPQIGPGKAARFETHAKDEGRMRVTGRAEDAYAFRTPSLRNVVKTAPYGHSGAYVSLGEFLAAHVDPTGAVGGFDRSQVTLVELPGVVDWKALDDPGEAAAISGAVTVPAVALSTEEQAVLLAFLESLTDPVALTGRLGIPDAVPSGLPIDR